MKTNAMRMLEKEKVPYKALEYTIDKDLFSGKAVSDLLGLDYDASYKTLGVMCGHDVYLCVIPVSRELDLKKAAKAIGVKSLEMIHVKDLLRLVGYERGSVSPIGAKRNKGIWFDDIALRYEELEISAGEFGKGLIVKREDLFRYLHAHTADITKEVS